MTIRAGKRGRITIYEVAAAAGVSISTASKALNDNGRMASATRERIKQAAAALGFRPNAAARSLLSRRSFTIGLLTNDVYGRFTLPVMAGISEALGGMGVSVFLSIVEDDNPAQAKIHINALLDKQVDGIIVAGKRIDKPLPVDLAHLPVPVVYSFTQGAAGSVTLTCDDFQGATMATMHLHECGRRSLAHITGPATFQSVLGRATAFRAQTGAGAPILCGPWSENWGYRAVGELLDRKGQEIDGIFCGNDQIARGVIDALRERGKRVPQDVSVVGFDNWEIVAAETRPPLTTIDMNLKELGREAGLVMMALTNGEAVETGLRRLPCRLLVRQSCGANLK